MRLRKAAWSQSRLRGEKGDKSNFATVADQRLKHGVFRSKEVENHGG